MEQVNVLFLIQSLLASFQLSDVVSMVPGPVRELVLRVPGIVLAVL